MKQLSSKSKSNHLGNEKIQTLVLKLAIPAMLAQFVNVLYSIIDRMYIGNIPEIGEIALAGAGICGPVVTMISAFAAWIGIGGAPLMSIRLGEKNEKGASQILSNCFVMLGVMSVLLTLLAYLFKDFLLVSFGATPVIFPYADEYMSICILGTVFSIFALGLNQFIICQGFSGLGMGSVLIGAVCNILLDPLFIFVFHMGVSGAAIATVLSQAVSCLFTMFVLFSGITPIRIRFSGYSLKICLKVLVVGFAPFTIILLDNVLIIVQNIMLKLYGGADTEVLLTCNTIVQSLMLMITMPLGGITGGTQAILGFNYGAGNAKRIRQAEKSIIVTGLIFCTVMFLLAQFGSHFFVRLFTQDALYIAKSVNFIRIYTLGVIPLAVQYAIVDGFTGMSIPQASLPLSLTRKIVYIGLVIGFCIYRGAETIFWAEPISDVLSAVISSVTFLCIFPRLMKKKR